MSIYNIHFYGPLNQATCDQFKECCLNALNNGATELDIYLSSDGGHTGPTFTMYNFVRALQVKTVMHNMGNVESMAVILYLAGDHRACAPHGRFKLHALHWGFEAGAIDHDRLAEFTESLDFDAERYAKIFDERVKPGCNLIDIRAHLNGRALILDSAAALASGVATEFGEAMISGERPNYWVTAR